MKLSSSLRRIFALLFPAFAVVAADNPTPAEQLRQSGMKKDDAGDRAGAIADYTRAIELDPRNVAAYTNRGMAREFSRDFDGARSDYARIMELDPADRNAPLMHGASFWTIGTHAEIHFMEVDSLIRRQRRCNR
jgi:tetratricopeptide (TPR) repeat protein